MLIVLGTDQGEIVQVHDVLHHCRQCTVEVRVQFLDVKTDFLCESM